MHIGSCKKPNVTQNKILYTLSNDPKARELKPHNSKFMRLDLNDYQNKLLDLTILIGHLISTDQRITRYMHLCEKIEQR